MDFNGSVLYAALAVTALAIYYFIVKSQSYWKQFNVPTPPYYFLLGHSLPQIRKEKALWEMFSEFYNQFKGKTDIIGMYFATKPAALVLDLDLVKRVMITDFEVFDSRGMYVNEKTDPISAHLFSIGGNKWRKLRTKLSPTFTSGKIKVMFPTVMHIAQDFAESVKVIVKENPSGFMIKNLTSRYTTDVIGSCAFGLECNSLKDPDNQFRKIGDLFIQRSFYRAMTSLVKTHFPRLADFLGMREVPEKVSNFFTKTVEETVKYRESGQVNRNDFMDLLVKIKHSENLEDRLTMAEIVSQSFIFFVAGFETSSSTMMFCLFELAKNQDVQEKARQHINAVIAAHNGALTYECLMDMDYLDKVVNETLRKYPTVPFMSRRANRDYTVPNSGVVIKKGTMVFIPTIAIQNDPEIYENPDDFNPNRFEKEDISKRHPCTFQSFGDGPRICIGLRFGMLQAKIGLVALLTAFKFSLSDETELPIPMHKFSSLLLVRDDIHLKVEQIDNK